MKNKIVIGVLALVIAGGAFWGGYAVGGSSKPNTFGLMDKDGNLQSRQTRMGGVGSALSGEIVSVDDGMMTIKTREGSSRVVLMGQSISVGKVVSGSGDDLVAGTNVMISGILNTDGSMTAQSIQIRTQLLEAAK